MILSLKKITADIVILAFILSNITAVTADATKTSETDSRETAANTEISLTNETLDDDTYSEYETESDLNSTDLEEILKELEFKLQSSKRLTYRELNTVYKLIPEKKVTGTGSSTVPLFDRPMSISCSFSSTSETSEMQNGLICGAISGIAAFVELKGTQEITKEIWEDNKNDANANYICNVRYEVKNEPKSNILIEQVGKYVHVSEIKFPYIDYVFPEIYMKIGDVDNMGRNCDHLIYNSLFGLQKKFYTVDLPDKPIIYFENVDLDNYMQDSRPIDIIERLQFDIEVESGKIFNELKTIANVGEKVHCTVEQLIMYHPISAVNMYYYVFKIKGSNGSLTFFNEVDAGADYLKTPYIIFTGNSVYENNQFIKYSNKLSEYAFAFKIFGASDESGLHTVNLIIENFSDENDYNNRKIEVEASNVEYEFFKENYSYRYCWNLYAKYHIDFFAQYPEYRNLTNNAVRDNNGNAAFDLKRYVNFIAQNELKLSPNEKPDWFANLGGGVSATVLGIKRVVNGKEKDTDIMLQLKGSSKTRWFTMERATPSDNLANDSTLTKGDLHYDIVMTAVKSFDGVNVEYYSDNANAHKIGLNILFDYQDGEVLYNGMAFVFDDAVKNVSPENQKYIGGGKSIYDNLFTPLELPQE